MSSGKELWDSGTCCNHGEILNVRTERNACAAQASASVCQSYLLVLPRGCINKYFRSGQCLHHFR